MGKGRIHIGTSGWNYDSWKGGNFYPEGVRDRDLLREYTRHFSTVEINRSFYRFPTPKAVADWYAQTPDDFIFACKSSRFLSHRRKLKEPEEPIERLLRTFSPLAEKLGPFLFQLPPRWKVNTERLHYFLSLLPSGYRYTMEFRDTSWLCDEVYELLERYGVSLCFYDFQCFRSPEVITADFIYIRLHGPNEQPYWGAYDGRTLSSYANKIKRWIESGRDVYCYFDNDQAGCAPKDAQRLLDKLG
ncbi:DUF72 domain-containing protein [Proteobacteria bacterium 005FR1]|nr:DUF72 domain-containing protein [Proteobacteria bacterium 005FR1]